MLLGCADHLGGADHDERIGGVGGRHPPPEIHVPDRPVRQRRREEEGTGGQLHDAHLSAPR